MLTLIFAGKVISYGFLLGLGFWASKKLTNFLDEQLLLHNKGKLEQLCSEMALN